MRIWRRFTSMVPAALADLMVLGLTMGGSGCASGPAHGHDGTIKADRGGREPSRAQQPAAALIPREVLFGNPERFGAQVSPGGTTLAYIAPERGVLNVWVRTIGQADDRALTHDTGRGIRAYFWARNSRQILYAQDKDGDENWQLYLIDATGGEPAALTPFDEVQAQVVAVPPEFPDAILVGLNNRVPQLHDVYRVNLATKARTLEVQNDIGATDWIADHRLRVRVAQIPQPDGGFLYMQRTDANAPWTEWLRVSTEDAMTTHVLGFAADNETIYLISSVGQDTASLRTHNLRTGEERVLASDPHADVSDVLVHPIEHRVQAVAFLKDRQEWHVLDAAITDDFRALGSLHHGDFDVQNRDRADRTWVVAYNQDKGPAVYYAYDRAAKRGQFLFSARPKLDEYRLAQMQPVEFKAKDGLAIHGYLTLPVGVQPKGLPAILNVHGGPWARDSWGYDPEAQWLANRGYAVLQINYRGSTGYGKAFINAGDKQWGGLMQQDMTDAVRWMIAQGIADPARVCIYGGSYGGYAVLAGLTFTPDVYACGVDIVGPSNLLTFINTIPPYWEPVKELFYRRVGHPQQDEALLRSRSPLFHIDRIEAPLLIAQGANDPRVKKAESLQIVEALRKAGKEIDYMEFPDEGHGFARPENRLTFYAAAERFLADHLGGRAEVAPTRSSATPAG